eukprot:EG_transcript_41905
MRLIFSGKEQHTFPCANLTKAKDTQGRGGAVVLGPLDVLTARQMHTTRSNLQTTLLCHFAINLLPLVAPFIFAVLCTFCRLIPLASPAGSSPPPGRLSTGATSPPPRLPAGSERSAGGSTGAADGVAAGERPS